MGHKRKKKSAFAAWCEYAALRAACAVVNVIPYRLACVLARGAAWTLVSILGFKRARTYARIKEVFPGKPRKECKRIAVFSLGNILQSAVEMIRAPRLTKDWITRHVKDMPAYADRLQAILAEGRGAVIMVPHSGNWYMAAWAMARYGMPLCAIAARQRNPHINAWMARQYGTIEVLTRGEAATLHDIRERIRGGRAFAILPDLRVPSPDVEVHFLNGTANVSHGGALFAVATGAPLVVAMMRRENGLHTFDHLATLRPDPDAPDKKEEACRLTRDVMSILDAAIQKTPEQWFWYNKRWLLQPVCK
ncbi:MAG: lysophospholipid acyltransferase family protein [Kiritimatiellae bacterium]|nr:lysophospholipid acyltransferase family protein [Kiritimatiellia bacterium]